MSDLIVRFERVKFPGISEIEYRYPSVTIVTSQISDKVPTWFTTKYFGTD
jgi:hypothetical protein